MSDPAHKPKPLNPKEDKAHEIRLLGYFNKAQCQAMNGTEQDAMFDKCFEYGDHLRANSRWGAGEALQSPETALTLCSKNDKVASIDGPYAETTRRLPRPRSARHGSRRPTYGPASRPAVRQHLRNPPSIR